MSLEAESQSGGAGGAGGLGRGRVRYFPVVPGKLEFALELRKLLLAAKPGVVAVELPGFLAPSYRRALARLHSSRCWAEECYLYNRVPYWRKLSTQSMHLRWNGSSPTATASSSSRIADSTWAQMAEASRLRMPME